MQVLRDFSSASKTKLPGEEVTPAEAFSVYYHDIFEYPLVFSEIIKWQPKNPPEIKTRIERKNGYYFVYGKSGLVYKRETRRRYSQNKIKIAKKATKILSYVPFIEMIGLSGSVAMGNAKRESDIDLIIITKRGWLWTSRGLSYLLLNLSGVNLRKPQDGNQKDKLCLNIWLDEGNLRWAKNQQNFYTAHEVLQVIPLLNKDRAYERWIGENKWALDYWPNAANVDKLSKNSNKYTKLNNINFIEKIAYKFQVRYMKGKISREVIRPGKAIFHPVNLSKILLQKLHI